MNFLRLNKFQRKRDCLKIFQFYVDTYPISRTQLINLFRQEYSKSEVDFALKRLEVDWNKQCFFKKVSLPLSIGMSRKRTREILSRAGFTEEEISNALKMF